MMTQQPHQSRLFDVRRLPLAPDPDRRDWLDALRGELPSMVPPALWKRGSAPLIELYVTGVAQGGIVGFFTGALAGTALLPVLGTAVGAVFGLVVAAPLALILAGAIAVVAARRHRPLHDPRRFHRQAWGVLLVGVGALDLTVVVVTAASFTDVSWRLLTAALLAVTAVVLLLLRRAARRIVVAYAEAGGWYRLTDTR